MSRLDFKRGKFNSDYETNEIISALEGWQVSAIGTTIDYYIFDAENSTSHDVYDEGHGEGKTYKKPFPLPVLQVTHIEGDAQNTPQGFYVNDTIYVKASFDQLRKAGLTKMDIMHKNYLRDRFEYDGVIFRVLSIKILGQIQSRDIMVGIEGTQVKPDELVNDAQFKKYSA